MKSKKNNNIKESGIKLKRDLINSRNKIKLVESKIRRKAKLILNEYSQYMDSEHNDLLSRMNIEIGSIDLLLEIVLKTEDNYIRANSKQIELFDI